MERQHRGMGEWCVRGWRPGWGLTGGSVGNAERRGWKQMFVGSKEALEGFQQNGYIKVNVLGKFIFQPCRGGLDRARD